MPPRNIRSSPWFKEVSGQIIEPTLTTSGTGVSGTIKFLPDGTIRISMTGSTVDDAISVSAPFAFDVTDLHAIGKATVADAHFSIRNGSTEMTSVKSETLDVLTRAVTIDDSARKVSRNDTFKVVATSTGGDAILIVDYFPL